MRKLTRTQQDALDKKLFQYRAIDKMIAIRKMEIETSREHMPDHVKVTSSYIQNIPQELTIKFSEDIVLQNLYLFRSTVETCYKQLTPELRVIFDKRWIDGYNTWAEIEAELNYGSKSIYRKRSAILEIYAELSGDAY